MTHHTPRRRPYRRRSRQVHVTATRREQPSLTLARILTSAALTQAQREAEAAAEYEARADSDAHRQTVAKHRQTGGRTSDA